MDDIEIKIARQERRSITYGELVASHEKVKAQRGQLREALENVMHYVETDDMRTLDFNKARAALKATEEIE